MSLANVAFHGPFKSIFSLQKINLGKDHKEDVTNGLPEGLAEKNPKPQFVLDLQDYLFFFFWYDGITVFSY